MSCGPMFTTAWKLARPSIVSLGGSFWGPMVEGLARLNGAQFQRRVGTVDSSSFRNPFARAFDQQPLTV